MAITFYVSCRTRIEAQQCAEHAYAFLASRRAGCYNLPVSPLCASSEGELPA